MDSKDSGDFSQWIPQVMMKFLNAMALLTGKKLIWSITNIESKETFETCHMYVYSLCSH